MQQIRPLFIVNPVAGYGRAQRIVPRLSSAFRGPAEVVFTGNPGDAETLAYQAALEEFSPVVAVGGDGTLQEVVNGLMRAPNPPPFGVIPAGTGNDLVRSLGLPADPVAATRLIWSGTAAEMDVAVCNDRYFLNVGGVGLDTNVVLAMRNRTGRLQSGIMAYLIQGLAELTRYSNPKFVLHLDGEVQTSRSLLVAVANGNFFAGGMKICPDASLVDGLLDVCVAGDLSRREVLGLIPLMYSGRHVHHPKVTFHRVRTLRIEAPAGMEVQLDGEIVHALPVEFRVVPRALKIAGWTAGASRFATPEIARREAV